MYDKLILKILCDAGENGLKLEKIARHVYNECNTLFEEHSLEEVHKEVTAIVVNQSNTKVPLFERRKWGVYRVNMSSPMVRAFLKRMAGENEQEWRNTYTDQTLPLFDEEAF